MMLLARATFLTWALPQKTLKTRSLAPLRRMGRNKTIASEKPNQRMEEERESTDGIQMLRNDRGKLEAMTVKELKAVMKDAGISANGKKQDLLSALENFFQKQEEVKVAKVIPTNEVDGQILASEFYLSSSEEKKKRGKLKTPHVDCSTEDLETNMKVYKRHKGTIKADVEEAKISKEAPSSELSDQHLASESSFLESEEKKRNMNSEMSQDNHSNTKVYKRHKEIGSVSQAKTEKVVPTYEASGQLGASKDMKKRGKTKMLEADHAKTKADKRHKAPANAEREDKPASETAQSEEPWTVLAHKKPQPGWVPYNPKTMRPPSDGAECIKLMSWNVNGLRALLKVDGFSALELAKRENFDILCFQETKMQEKDVKEIKERLIEGYDNSFWTCSVSKLGYSGTAVISRSIFEVDPAISCDPLFKAAGTMKPISVSYGLGIEDHDSEGRLVTVEFDKFYVLCSYVPNSGDGLKRLTYRVTQWDPSLSNYMKKVSVFISEGLVVDTYIEALMNELKIYPIFQELEKSKPVILTGDLNCAHEEIDIYNPAGNRRSAGFTIEERESFQKNFLSRGFVDTFRRQHPGVVAYTYWGYRHGGRKTNRGWRLDYFLVSESIANKVHDSYILPDVVGSDHCPIGLILKL